MEAILATGAAGGVDWSRPAALFLTHGHADHSGGASILRERLTATTFAGPRTAEWMRVGDPALVSLPAAMAAGIYPADYAWVPCPIDRTVADRKVIAFGDLTVQALATPGHSADHTAWLVRRGERAWLVAGDSLFHGGRIALQNTPDCDTSAHAGSLRRLAELDFDALLPGHGLFSLRDGRRHSDAAVRWLDRLLLPPQLA